MAALTSELRVQAGTQTVWGTSVTPTVLLRGVTRCNLAPDQEVKILNDLTLNLSGGDTPVMTRNGGGGTLEGWASYDDLAYYLDAMFGQATPGVGPTYARPYLAPVTSVAAPRILSIVHGDANVGAYRLTGAVGNKMTLRIQPATEATISMDFIGATIEPTTLATGLTTRTVVPIMGGDVNAMFLDNWAGTMGTTALTKCTLRSLELTVNANRKNRYCVGALTAADYITMPWDGTLDLMLEWNSVSKGMVDTLVNGAAGKHQFDVNLTGGTSKTLRIQFAGTIDQAPTIFEDDDGVVATRLRLRNTYHPTFANWLKITSGAALQTLA